MLRILYSLPGTLFFVGMVTTLKLFPVVFALPPPIHPASEELADGDVDTFAVPPLAATARDEKVSKEQPYLIALPNPVSVTPHTHGTWDTLGDGTKVWRIRLQAPDATSAVVGFKKLYMPAKGTLFVYSYGKDFWLRPITSADQTPTGVFWLPVVPTNDLVLEVNLPPHANVFSPGEGTVELEEALDLEIGWINSGIRPVAGASEATEGQQGRHLLSGSCNNDVVCAIADDWRKEIKAVAQYVYAKDGVGNQACTGTLINNVKQDGTPYFLTANHCVDSDAEAASVTITWNFETSLCGGTPDGSMDDVQMGGAMLIATNPASDFTLLLLNSNPLPEFDVAWAGWDNTGAEASTSVGIHHPQGCEKRISFENDPTTTTAYLDNTVDSNADFTRVADWDSGTTEVGSSGSALFNENHHIVGQLRGGNAACGNDASDWYGKFSTSWDAGATDDTRLKDWLDPDDEGATTLDSWCPDRKRGKGRKRRRRSKSKSKRKSRSGRKKKRRKSRSSSESGRSKSATPDQGSPTD